MVGELSIEGNILDLCYPVGDLEATTILQHDSYSGDYEASCTWAAPSGFNAGWFRAGAAAQIGRGARCWKGFMGEPTYDGTSWRLSFFGDGAETQQYPSPDPDASNMNDNIQDANVLGMRWSNHGNDFTGGAFNTAPISKIVQLDEALYKIAATKGKFFHVSSGVGALVAEGTGVDWVMSPQAAHLGTTDQGLLNAVVAVYATHLDAEGRADAWAVTGHELTESITQHRYHGIGLDLTELGVLDYTVATQIAAEWLKARGGRMAWTNGFEMTAVNSRSAINGVTSPLMIRAGDRVTIPGVVDMRSSTTYRPSLTVTAGKVRLIFAEQKAVVEPLGLAVRTPEDVQAIATRLLNSSYIYLGRAS